MPAVIFDVDGTLIDNSFLHTLAWFRACREHGVEASMATLHRLVGMGGDQLVPALIGHQRPELDDAHARHMEPLRGEAPVIEGAAALLEAVAARGLAVVIATSAGHDEALAMLRRVVNPEVVDIFVTNDDVGSSKPAPDLVAVALERADLHPQEAVFIGDTRWDIEAAGRAGVQCIAVESGGWGACELEVAGAVAVYRDCADVLAKIQDSPIAALSPP